MRNPFQYGKLAERENFIDREADRAFLKQTLASGINVILVSPRRWGKSSLVKQAMSELLEEEDDVRVCMIDAYPITSSTEFYETFAREVLKCAATRTQQIFDLVKRFLGSITPKLSFGANEMEEFSVSFDFSGPRQDKSDILNLPEKIAQEHGVRLIICIDEFQNLAKLPDYGKLESNMRSVWQHHQNVSYCLYGSRRHMMSEIFDSSEKPFYRFGQFYYLRKIGRTDWIEYIKERFASTGKSIDDDLAGRIVDDAECHSWYVQQLAGAVWSRSGKDANEDDYGGALTWSIDVNSESYHNICSRLTESQIGMLRAVAAGETQLTADATLRKYRMGSSANAVKNKKTLLNMDLIAADGAGYVFLDPLFGKWFVGRYGK